MVHVYVDDVEGLHEHAGAAGADVTELEDVSGGCGLAAFVWGTEPPAFSIGYDEPLGPWDSGFSVLFDDAPDPDDLPPPSAEGLPAGITLVCLHCLLDDHPELGRGLAVAREHGVADLDGDGEWVGGDLSRLAP